MTTGRAALLAATCPLLVGALATSAKATVVLLNFGGSGDPGSTTSHVSPGDLADNAAGAWSFPGSSATWNLVSYSAGGLASGSVVNDAGSTVNNVSVVLGAGNNSFSSTNPGSTTFTTNSANLYWGSSSDPYKNANLSSSGVYASSITNAAYFSTGIGDSSVAAAEVNGLPAGTYSVYVVGANQNSLQYATNDYAADIGQSPSSYNYVTSSLTPTAVTNPSGPTSWTAGTDYAEFNITISSGDSIGVFVEGAGNGVGGEGTQTRGFLDSIEIVSATPEPGTLALFAGAAGVLLRRRSRLRAAPSPLSR